MVPVLGLIGVGYALALALHHFESLAFGEVAVCSLAVLLGTIPLGLRRTEPAARRLSWLAIASALVVIGVVLIPHTLVLVEYTLPMAFSAVGFIMLDMALTVPKPSIGSLRLRRVRVANGMVGFIAAGAGVIAILPAISVHPTPWLVSAHVWLTPAGYALSALLVSLVIRERRRRDGATPLATSENARALFGLYTASAVLLPFLVWTAIAKHPLGGELWSLVLGFALLSIVGSHGLTIHRWRAELADAHTRQALSIVLTIAFGTLIAFGLRRFAPQGPAAWMIFTAGLLAACAALYGGVTYAVRLLLRPHFGRLLDAIEAIKSTLGRATTLETLAECALLPIREASRAFESEPVLWLVDPPYELRIDQAGLGRVERRGAPSALFGAMMTRPKEILVRSHLETMKVRRPDVRELTRWLSDLDVLCAVPLVHEESIMGALLIPQGKRKSTLTIEEANALSDLAILMATTAELLLTRLEARDRYVLERAHREALEEQLQDAQGELVRWSETMRVLERHHPSGEFNGALVTRSDAMQELVRRLKVFAPLDVPILVQSPSLREAMTVARLVHDKSASAAGRFLVADCGSINPKRVRAHLFGEAEDGASFSWFSLAQSGTLVLKDIVALPLEVQEELARCLAERRHPNGHALELRLVITVRESLDQLVTARRMAPALAERLKAQRLEVPPLALRQEDLHLLTLSALDRAVRCTGRESVGIGEEALERIFAHAWRGDVEELEAVITQAVLQTDKAMLGAKDLPLYGEMHGAEELEDPYLGTYASLEQQILLRAIERAGGNKSEAARALGLKRTTFIDKLRRFGLDDSEDRRFGGHAA